MNRYSECWSDYTKIVDEIKNINRSNPKYLEIKKKLFETYELYYNMNNTIEIITVKTIFKKWLDKNCFAMTNEEKENFHQQLDFSKYKLIRDIVDYIIDNLSDKYCCLSCSESSCSNCKHELAYEIVKHSNKFICFPQTDSNVEIFLKGATMYLEKEISQKDYFNSPIEEIMFEALLPIVKKYGYTLKREYTVRDTGRTEIRYALDLAILKGDKLILDIETDGLKFHKDFYAMAADRQRDRWLLMRGVPVIRFTSREVFDDLDNSLIQIEQVLEVVSDWNKG